MTAGPPNCRTHSSLSGGSSMKCTSDHVHFPSLVSPLLFRQDSSSVRPTPQTHTMAAHTSLGLYTSSTLNFLQFPKHTTPSPTPEAERILSLLPLLPPRHPWVLLHFGSPGAPKAGMGTVLYHNTHWFEGNSFLISYCLNRLYIHTCLKIQTILKNVQ